MSKSQILTVTIINWEKYNKRQSDIKHPRWFALNHDLFDDEKLFKLNLEEISCFIYLLCRCSSAADRRQTAAGTTFSADLELTERRHRISKDTLLRTLKKLSAAAICTYAVRNTASTLQDITRQDRTEQNAAAVASADISLKVVKEAENEEFDKVVARVFNWLNRLSGVPYRPASRENRKLLRALIKLGHTDDDIIMVCRHRCRLWGDDPKMKQYLRPSTLFRLSKFEEYLPAAKDWCMKADRLFGALPHVLPN